MARSKRISTIEGIGERFISAEEAGRFLGVEKSTIYAWKCSGKLGLPYRLHGRRLVFLPSELRAWSDKRNHRDTDESPGK